MRQYWNEMNQFFARFLTPGVRGLFFANVLIFFLYVLLAPLSGGADFTFFMMMETPYLLVQKFCLWQPVTYMFLHAGFAHLLFNMLILWFFGPRLEYRWGTAKFLRFYFIVGIFSGLFHPAIVYLTGKMPFDALKMALHGLDASPAIFETFKIFHSGVAPVYPLLGASGALYGILLAYALYYPDDIVLVYFIIPIKIKYLMVILALITFFSSVESGGPGGVSHVTHLGGLLVAAIYLLGPSWWRGFRGGGRKRVTIIEVDPRRHPDFQNRK